MDPIFQESPRPINDLRSGFGLQCFLGAWNLVRHHVNAVWGASLQLAVLLNPLLALDDVRAHAPSVDFALVALGRVRAQDYALVFQPSLGQWQPLYLADGGWAWGLRL